jgi:tRNA(Ile)-lysidine synthase
MTDKVEMFHIHFSIPMNVLVEPGKYVVAVSGGVDSVVLLDVLTKLSGLDLVVAHFDHGMRSDSADDAVFVQGLAEKYGLTYSMERVTLGAGASEAAARQARYDFLHRVREQTGARAIITAHHQDDLLETAIFNIIRGTGRRGLTALSSTTTLCRPLLDMPKAEIIAYATQQNLSWHEDTTNHDEQYARNYIRHRLLVRFNTNARRQLLASIHELQSINNELDQLLADLVPQSSELDRQWFIALPHTIAREVMTSWLRQNGITDYDRPTLERLTVKAKVLAPGKYLDVRRGYQLAISSKCLALKPPER